MRRLNLSSDGKARRSTAIAADERGSLAPSERCPPHIDPMVNIAVPEIDACTDKNVEYKDKTITLTGGQAFCEGLKITGSSHITLQPGVYVIDNGKLEIQDGAILEGEDVTILLIGDKAELEVKNSASFRLTAPSEGPYKGLLIFQSEGKTKDNVWDSDTASELTGVVYMPDGYFTSKTSSNIIGTNACFVLIIKEMMIDGLADISIDLSSSACRNSLPNAFSRSVVLLS